MCLLSSWVNSPIAGEQIGLLTLRRNYFLTHIFQCGIVN